jgi:hypothetical protein
MENEEPRPLLVSFIASGQGAWRIERIDTIVGESLPAADRLEVVESPSPSLSVAPAWVLRGVTSNVRYTNRLELDALQQSQEPLNRPLASKRGVASIQKTKETSICPTTKRLEAFGTTRATFSCVESEVMDAASYIIKEWLLARL